MFKNAVIGTYEMDLSYIYFKDKHAIFNQWIGISNPTAQNYNELSGYLKVSASVIGPGDEQVPLVDSSSLDRTDKEVILLPPHISLHYYQVKFRLIKAEKLPKMDTFGTIDAFVKVDYLGKSIKTSVVTQKNDQLYWSQEIWLPVQAPLVSSRIVLSLLDEDTTTNELVGSMSFQIHKIIKLAKQGKEFPWFWKDIYGSAPNVSGKHTDEMNTVPEIASHWKGRILMQVTAEKTDKPEMKLKNVEDDVMKKAANFMKLTKFEIKAEVRQGICLPDKKLKVKIKIADFEIITSSPKQYGNGFCYWNTTFDERIWTAPYHDLDDMADVCIYIMDGDSPICYYRCKATEFREPNADLKWVALINDKSVGQVSEAHQAGMLSFRLSINNQNKNGDIDWSYVPAWSYDLSDKPDKYPIRCYVYQCKELPASDDNGTSDPYVKIWSPFTPTDAEKKMMTTSVVNDNNNPIFYNTIQSYYYSVDYDWSPPVVLDIYDQDSGTFSTDDFIGRAVIFLDQAGEAVSRDEKVPRPQWFPVKLGFRDDEPAMGQILVSFSVLTPKQQFKKSLSTIRLAPMCDEYEITINVLGLRDLESPGILPVRKAFINFMLRSLLPPSKAHAIENISTQPSAIGRNPTISTVVKFNLFLPNDPLYCPSLTCGVYDYIFKGVSQPLIGNFVINIGDLQHLQDDLFMDEDKTTKEIVNALQDKILHAEEYKKELQARKQEGQKEKEYEEAMKKNIMAAMEQKERKNLAIKTTKDLFSSFKKNKEEKELTIEPEFEDIEMGLIQANDQNETMQRLEETKEEPQDNALKFMQKKNTQIEHEKENERLVAKEMMSKREEQKQILKQSRTGRMKKMFKQMKHVGKNVVYPTYQYDDRLKIYREGIAPPKEVYMAVGYDPKHDSKQKHYRRFYEDELENIEEVMPGSPFQTFPVMRGQSRGLSKGWFWKQNTDEAGQVSTLKEVGKFKGIVSVMHKDREKAFSLVKETRIKILKESLNTLSQALFKEDFKYDYDKLSSAEGRELFCAKLQQIGCDDLEIEKHFTQMNYQEELARLMMTTTNC